MTYKILTARIENDGSLTLGKRAQMISWSSDLRVGGLYQLRTGKLYKVVGVETA